MDELKKELNNLLDNKKIKKIQFGLVNPNELKRRAVCEVKKGETFDGIEPVINGLFDPRMGILERGQECPTCENSSVLCPGHFGYVDLAIPVFYMHYIDYIKKLLSCVCFRCSSLLSKKKQKIIDMKNNEERFKTIYKLSTKVQKDSRCCVKEGCKIIQPTKYTVLYSEKIKNIEKNIPGLEKDTIVAIIADFKEEAVKDASISKKQRITPIQCYNIFKRITDEDCMYLGFNPKYSRPEWMICTTYPVSPPSVRPSIQRESTHRAEDDLTSVVSSIVKANNLVKKKIEQGDDNKKIEIYSNLVQWNIGTSIVNPITGVSKNRQRTGKPIKSITERLKGKPGRIRGNLLAKRVDYSARSVITNSPKNDIDEVGVPLKIAMSLTYPEIVTRKNMDELTKIVRNGPTNYPGAKKVESMKFDCYGTPSPCSINLKHIDSSQIKLEIGDIVHRHLKNGDYVLFNRQPSLHRMSMMCLKSVIVDDFTFRLNVFACKPYGADFDGDEMNLHLPQNVQTLIENVSLTKLSKQIISPAKSSPIITPVQDTLLGTYLLTRDADASSGEDLFHYMIKTLFSKNVNLFQERRKDVISGGDIFNMLLPSMNYSASNLINGSFKSNLSKLVQYINQDFGYEKSKNFMDNLQRLIISWTETKGFTIGFGDCITENEITDDIEKLIEEKKKEADELIRTAELGLYQPYLSNELKIDSLSRDIENIGGMLSKDVGEVIKNNLSKDNNFNYSIDSGTKGDQNKLNQIVGFVGQQSIDTERIQYGWKGRTLPHFTKYDINLASRGFIFNSYVNGITPQEFFYQAMASRSGSIGTNIKTAVAGYIQRKLIKSLEDLVVRYDGTVRNQNGNIYQLNYGGDGFDSIYLEKVVIKLISMSNEEMNEKYFWNKLPKELFSIDFKENKEVLLKEWEQLKKNKSDLVNIYYKTNKEDNTYIKGEQDENHKILSPVNIDRSIKYFIKKFSIDNTSKTDLEPSLVISKVEELVNYLSRYTHDNNSCPKLKIYIRSMLSSKDIILKYRFQKKVFINLIESLKTKILNSFVDPGENVGVIAAQSIGEPVTQMTLDTFHFSGLGSTQQLLTGGTDRFNEIMMLSKTKTPSMTVYLKPEYSNNKEIAYDVKNQIENTIIRDLVLKCEVLYIPNKAKGKYDEEELQFKIYDEISKLTEIKCPEVDSLSNWLLWIEFNRESILKKNISMNDIYLKINEKLSTDTDISCVIANMNSEHLTVRIRIKRDLEDTDNYISFFKTISDHILDIKLRGIDGIKTVFPPNNLFNEWVLTTDGSNLIDVLSNKYVDIERTRTNDLNEIYKIFGIEGLRKGLIDEIDKTISSTNPSINERHFALLSDLMISQGEPMRIHRNGFGSDKKIGTLSRASFESMDRILINAGVFAESDDMKGTSANVIMAQQINCGTGSFDLLINKDLLPVETKKEDVDVKREELDDYISSIGEDDFADTSDFNFGYNVLSSTEFNISKIPEQEFNLNIIANKENSNKKKRRKR